MALYGKINKNINLIKLFYEDNDKFNIIEYKKLNKNIKDLNKLQITKLNNIYGVGNNTLFSLYNKYGLNNRIKILKLKSTTFRKIKNSINKSTSKNRLRSKQIEIRKFATVRLKNYKGMRHLLRYPVRGQRTHSNGKTRKRLKNTEYNNLT